MATNLIRKLYNTARHTAIRAYIGYRALRGATRQYQKDADKKAAVEARKTKANIRQKKFTAQEQRKRVRSRVLGVRKLTKTVTTGSRVERAGQLRHLRSNPATKAVLRRRIKFYTR